MINKLSIPETLRGCHQLVTKTRQALTRVAKAADDYTPPVPETGILDLRVSRKALPRALRLLEAVIRACESKGWKVEPKNEREQSRICVEDDPVSFSMFEKTERIELPSTKDEKARWYWRPKYKHEDTGLLTLQISDWLPDRMRRTWSDGKRQRLEDMLEEFLDGVLEASASNKKGRLEREEWHRQYEEAQRRREENERRIKIEKSRRADLLAQCAGREKAHAIRQVILEIRNRASAEPNEWRPDETSRWVEWAEGFANRSDPFANGYFRRALQWTELDADLDCGPEA